MDNDKAPLPSFALHKLPTLTDDLGRDHDTAIPNPIAHHPLYHPSPAFFISATDVVLCGILFDASSSSRRLPPRGAASRGPVRLGTRACGRCHLRGTLSRDEHRRLGARRRALRALQSAERVPRVLL